MSDLELRICEDVRHDITEICAQVWEIEIVYAFWSEYSSALCAQFMDYERGDFQTLMQAVDIVEEEFEK